MNWKFYINDIEIDEPAGFADFSIMIKRDEIWKGIFFEASASSLQFYDDAFDILQTMKQTTGMKSVAIFKASLQCDGESSYQEAIRGKLNFGQYKETCGVQCFITMPVEQDNCIMILRNRYDQKVNIDDPKSFNKTTTLPVYDGLNKLIDLPTFEMPIAVSGTVGNDVVDNYTTVDFPLAGFTGNVAGLDVRPTFYNEIENSIKSGELIPANSISIYNLAGDTLISPYLLFEETPLCTSNVINYTFRLKGSYDITVKHHGGISETFLELYKFNGFDNTFVEIVTLLPVGTTPPHDARSFDHTFSGTTTLAAGESIGAKLTIDFRLLAGDSTFDGSVTYDPETSCEITMTRECPPTTTTGYLINEVAARIAEAITDLCITVKSDYYGRTDSQPFASLIDGCGSLRMLTNGLRIRQAEKNNEFFLSMKDLFDGLNAIDNIGIGIEDDPAFPGTDKKLLRIEPAGFFFNDSELMICDSIPQALKSIIETSVFAKIVIGYDKFESGSVKGTDEFNTQKEFRTSIDATDTQLMQLCKFIAGTYPIEVTRQQHFVESGEADTMYDSETFILCLMRSVSIDFAIEQGNIETPSNILSADTLYNWRIRPFYNLMRWAKSILQSYVDIHDADSKIFFSSGKGNYTASGELPDDDPCKLENGAKAENEDLSIEDFQIEANGLPILKAESISFDYSLSVDDYRKIKSNPYGFISVQCGSGEFLKAYINQVEYRVADGMATFNLFLKWQ